MFRKKHKKKASIEAFFHGYILADYSNQIFKILNSVLLFSWCSLSEHSVILLHLLSNFVSPYPFITTLFFVAPFEMRYFSASSALC
ncbi:MAG: hypothetical protein ACI9LS_002013 [Flavobacteriales bacterium]|jgi:hypothetical protein